MAIGQQTLCNGLGTPTGWFILKCDRIRIHQGRFLRCSHVLKLLMFLLDYWVLRGLQPSATAHWTPVHMSPKKALASVSRLKSFWGLSAFCI